jgi:hypothetical protein
MKIFLLSYLIFLNKANLLEAWLAVLNMTGSCADASAAGSPAGYYLESVV